MLLVGYLVAAEIGKALSFEPGHVATFWPPSGLLLAFLLKSQMKAWPFIVSTAATSNLVSDVLFHGTPLLLSCGFTLANMTEGMVGAWILRRCISDQFSIERLPDVVWLIGVSCVSPMVSGIIATTVIFLWFADTSVLDVFLVWWIADCVGILIVAPLTYGMFYSHVLPLSAHHALRLAEALLCFALIACLTLVVIWQEDSRYSFPFLLIPLLLWPALRFGTAAVATGVGVIAVIVTLSTQAGEGAFFISDARPEQKAILVQMFLAVCSAPFLVLAAMWHERKAAGEAMERRIEQRTQQLEEADQRKDHFLAVLAHELRNPLAPLSHALQLWPTVVTQPDRLTEIHSIMSNQVRHMTGLIDDLLDVSRIAGGKILLRKECLDIRDVIGASLESIQSQAQSCRHRIHWNRPQEPLWVHGDRSRLLQIVGNLLHNAVKYTPANGVIKLEARRASHRFV